MEIEIPKTLEDTPYILNKLIEPESLKEFKEASEDEVLGISHFGLGMWLRNNWRLWEQDESKKNSLVKELNALGIYHGDDLSGIILTSYHRALNGKPIELEAQVQHYKEFWAEHGCSPDGKKLNE